jgi:nondiscriminating glutamyl-tRNA synthetase
MEVVMSVRVRYAPSPTGYLHIGNARTALFNYLYAKKYGGTFIIRIEDTDIERNVESGIENQLEMAQWLGLDWDESVDKPGAFGPYRQLERLDIYQKYADQLLASGHAYKCYCTKEELEAEKEALIAKGDDRFHYSQKCLHAPDQDKPYAIRFHVPSRHSYTFNDIVKGEVTFQSEDVGDWVMVKQNGIPTYNFACVVDDHLMEISHVLRGEDHITNTPRQMMVFEALNWPVPTYGHMTLIVNHEGKKLSKRDHDILQYIGQYQDKGYLPEALFNFIALLGFSPGEKELLTKEELIEAFDATKLSNHPATFDTQKLDFFNSQYLKKLEIDALKTLTRPFVEKEGILKDRSEEWFESLLAVFQERMVCGEDIISLYQDFLEQPFTWDDEAKQVMSDPNVKALVHTFAESLETLSPYDPSSLKALIQSAGEATGSKGKMLFMPIRLATTGSMHGPELPKLLHLLGQDLIRQRLEQAIAWLNRAS